MSVTFVWMHGPVLPVRVGVEKFRPGEDVASPRTATRRELEASFTELGINCDQIAFYNQPAFKAAERKDPALFQRYAEFIEATRFSDEYVARARRAIPKIAAYLRAELARDGQEGACVDCSLALSKILEKLGIWNYVAAGSVTVEFDPQTGLPTQHWPHLLGSEKGVGHAWVSAPPFRVIDLTINQQRNAQRIRPHLPEMIVSETCEPVAEIGLDDLLHPDLQHHILTQYGELPTIHQVMERKPEIARLLRTFRPFGVRTGAIFAKYIPCCMTALEEPFEAIQSQCFSRRPLPSIFDDLVRACGLDSPHC
jgi:hypothetical protein